MSTFPGSNRAHREGRGASRRGKVDIARAGASGFRPVGDEGGDGEGGGIRVMEEALSIEREAHLISK